jgi:hypothetical protein
VSRAIRFVVLANGKLYCTGLMIVGRSEVEAGDAICCPSLSVLSPARSTRGSSRTCAFRVQVPSRTLFLAERSGPPPSPKPGAKAMSHLNRRNALTALGALSGLAAFPAAFDGTLRQALVE